MSTRKESTVSATIPVTHNGTSAIRTAGTLQDEPQRMPLSLDALSYTASPDTAAAEDGLASWDLESLRVKEDCGIEIAGEPVLASVQVRKPTKQEWIRVRAGQEWRFHTALLIVEEDRSSYLIAPPLWDELTMDIAITTLYTTMSRAGVLFLWPVRMVLADRPSGGDTWNRSAHDAARLAETSWVRLTASQANREYHIRRATGLADPGWPAQIDSFETLMRLAFKDRFITDLGHPVVRRLRGEV
jgi:hypothetical protein